MFQRWKIRQSSRNSLARPEWHPAVQARSSGAEYNPVMRALLAVLLITLSPTWTATAATPPDLVMGSQAKPPDLQAQKRAGLRAQASGDFQRAWELLLPVAESGDADAQYQMGWLSEQGWEGFAGDLRQAAAWHRLAAQQDHARAQLWLGYRYAGRMSPGASSNGDPEQMKDGVHWLSKAARRGNVEAQMLLADIYWNGSGFIPKDRAYARHWLQMAAAAGNTSARVLLGQN